MPAVRVARRRAFRISVRRIALRALYCVIVLWATIAMPVAWLNMTLVEHAARSAQVRLRGTETRDLYAIGALVARRVDSDTATRLWTESASRFAGVPLSTLRLLMVSTIITLALSVSFSLVASGAVYRLARLASRSEFICLPVSANDKRILAWKLLFAALPTSCATCLFVGACIAWETGFAGLDGPRVGAAWSLGVGALSLTVATVASAGVVARTSRGSLPAAHRRWHCTQCGYEVGESTSRGCPECGAGAPGAVAKLPDAPQIVARSRKRWFRAIPLWVPPGLAAFAMLGGVIWVVKQVRAAQVGISGPLQIATRWRGVTYVKWEDGTEAVFTQGVFTSTGPDLTGRQFTHDRYRRIVSCAWSRKPEQGWNVETWASPWFDIGVARECTGPMGYQVTLVSPGSPHGAGVAWLSPRAVVAVAQFDGDQVNDQGVPAIVRRVWNANEQRAMNIEE